MRVTCSFTHDLKIPINLERSLTLGDLKRSLEAAVADTCRDGAFTLVPGTYELLDELLPSHPVLTGDARLLTEVFSDPGNARVIVRVTRGAALAAGRS
jgi:hypothetical protein